MSWIDLLFLHWPMDPDYLGTHLPAGLVPDTYDGKAWIGIVPFTMAHVAPWGLPSLDSISFFLEMNVRTYVRPAAGGHPGVYFFSLDCNHGLAVRLARWGYGLRYFHADLEWQDGNFMGRRRDRRANPAMFRARYSPASESCFYSRPGSLEYFLTERYWLYSSHPVLGLVRGQVHHRPWPLRRALVEDLQTNLIESHGLAGGLLAPQDTPQSEGGGSSPHSLYADRVDVVAWGPVPLRWASR